MGDNQLYEIERKINFDQIQQSEFRALEDGKEFSKLFRKGEIGSCK